MGNVYPVPYVIDVFSGFSTISIASMTPEQLATYHAVVDNGIKIAMCTYPQWGLNSTYYCGANDNTSYISCYYRSDGFGVFRLGSNGLIGNNTNGTAFIDTRTVLHENIFTPASTTTFYVDYYSTREEAYDAILGRIPHPITYRLTNATTTGPNEAIVGDTVTVPLTFSEGYGIVNPSSDVYVTCNGVLVPSTYSNGQLVFTMPDPS